MQMAFLLKNALPIFLFIFSIISSSPVDATKNEQKLKMKKREVILLGKMLAKPLFFPEFIRKQNWAASNIRGNAPTTTTWRHDYMKSTFRTYMVPIQNCINKGKLGTISVERCVEDFPRFFKELGLFGPDFLTTLWSEIGNNCHQYSTILEHYQMCLFAARTAHLEMKKMHRVIMALYADYYQKRKERERRKLSLKNFRRIITEKIMRKKPSEQQKGGASPGASPSRGEFPELGPMLHIRIIEYGEGSEWEMPSKDYVDFEKIKTIPAEEIAAELRNWGRPLFGEFGEIVDDFTIDGRVREAIGQQGKQLYLNLLSMARQYLGMDPTEFMFQFVNAIFERLTKLPIDAAAGPSQRTLAEDANRDAAGPSHSAQQTQQSHDAADTIRGQFGPYHFGAPPGKLFTIKEDEEESKKENERES